MTAVRVETRTCMVCGGGPCRKYLNGPLCDRCRPVLVVPPHGLVPMSAHAPSATLVDDRAIASGKRRAHPSAAAGARAAESARRAHERAARAGTHAPEPAGPAAANVASLATPSVRPGRTATSAAAAVKAFPKSGTQRRRILDALAEAVRKGAGGATDPELSRHLALSPNSVRPRRGELVQYGLVVDSGRTRPHEGNEHIVWAPTPIALSMLPQA